MSSNPLFDHRHLGLILALYDLVLFAYILDDMLRTGDRGANRIVALLDNTVLQHVCHLMLNLSISVFNIGA